MPRPARKNPRKDRKGRASIARREERRKSPKHTPFEWEGDLSDIDRIFLTALANTGRARLAAKAAGVCGTWHAQRCRVSPDFQAAYALAREAAVELVLEDKAWELVSDGSERVIIEMLRAHRPSVYRPSWDPSTGGMEEHRKTIEIVVTTDTLNMHLPAQQRPGPFDHIRRQLPEPTLSDHADRLLNGNGHHNGHHKGAQP